MDSRTSVRTTVKIESLIARSRAINDCWVWIGAKTHNGYGLARHGKMKRAHRLMWELWFGKVPPKMQVLHRCDVPACIRPSHLFLGDHDDNMADKVSKGRVLKGEENLGGRKLTQHQVSAIIRAPVSVKGSTLAKRYGVSGSMISGIRKGHHWKHLPRLK